MPPDPRAIDEIHATIRRFIDSSRQAAYLEPGEAQIALTDQNHSLELRAARLTLQVWDETRSLSRRISGIRNENAGKLELTIERFGKQTGTATLIDLSRPTGQTASKRGQRLEYRERFRRSLSRQFPRWPLKDLSTEPDLEHSLSPAFARALLAKGSAGIAAIGAPPGAADGAGVLTYGLIWLEYLRRREPDLSIGKLAVFVPVGAERSTSLRVLHLDQTRAEYAVFSYDDTWERQIDLQDFGNIDTRVEPLRVERDAGPVRPPSSNNPESWLEAQLRRHIDRIDPTLSPEPIYGQVPALAGLDRSVLDLLAVDRNGRLAIIELKASEDPQLPLQALDYWVRVDWHRRQNDFAKNGYFPGIGLRDAPPRLLLMAPALQFHPSTETVLSHIDSRIDVECIGVAMNWREDIRIAFRRRRGEAPMYLEEEHDR